MSDNVAYGEVTGAVADRPQTLNVFVGYNAAKRAVATDTRALTRSVVLGAEAAPDLEAGDACIVIGHRAAERVTEGDGLIAIGDVTFEDKPTAERLRRALLRLLDTNGAMDWALRSGADPDTIATLRGEATEP